MIATTSPAPISSAIRLGRPARPGSHQGDVSPTTVAVRALATTCAGSTSLTTFSAWRSIARANLASKPSSSDTVDLRSHALEDPRQPRADAGRRQAQRVGRSRSSRGRRRTEARPGLDRRDRDCSVRTEGRCRRWSRQDPHPAPTPGWPTRCRRPAAGGADGLRRVPDSRRWRSTSSGPALDLAGHGSAARRCPRRLGRPRPPHPARPSRRRRHASSIDGAPPPGARRRRRPRRRPDGPSSLRAVSSIAKSVTQGRRW